MVGIIVNCTHSYERAILRGVTRYANIHRRWLLLSDVRAVYNDFGDLPSFDGAVFGGVPLPVLRQALARTHCVVLCSGGPETALAPVVNLDDVAAGRQAAEHLLSLRLEHFAYYWNEQYLASQNRLNGFRSALRERGFSCVTCPLPTPTAEQRLSRAHRAGVIEWLRGLPKPLGVMAFDDWWAADLAEACREGHITVPEEVAIVGVNNDDLICDTAWPPLSSIDPDFSRMGYAAAQILDRLLAGETLKPEERYTTLPPLGVVQRQSTNTLAIKDRQLAAAIRFIRERACDPCSVADVLEVVPVGRRWLERQFVRHLGRTPHDEIVRVRIEAAQRLLVHTRLDMFAVASRCGFADLKSFYLAFRKMTQSTPAAYRRAAMAETADPG